MFPRQAATFTTLLLLNTKHDQTLTKPISSPRCLTAVTSTLYVQLQKALTLNLVLQWYQHAR